MQPASHNFSRPSPSHAAEARQWRNFLLAFALFFLFILGYMWLSHVTLPANCTQPPSTSPATPSTPAQDPQPAGGP
jgi:hypothetical protein